MLAAGGRVVDGKATLNFNGSASTGRRREAARLSQPGVDSFARKEQSPHLFMADYPNDLSEAEERQEQDKSRDGHPQEAFRIPAKERRKAFSDRVSMPHTYQDGLQYMEADEQQREDETLMKDRIDERLVVEPRSGAKMLADEQDFGKNEGVHDRKGMLRVIQMMLRQDDAGVDRQQPEDNPKIEEDRKKTLELLGGFFLQGSFLRNW